MNDRDMMRRIEKHLASIDKSLRIIANNSYPVTTKVEYFTDAEYEKEKKRLDDETGTPHPG